MNKFQYKNQWLYPTTGFLILTNDCNLRCRYCFVEQHPDYMSFEVAQQTADWLYNNLKYKKEQKILTEESKALIVFFGGEPLLQYNNIIKPLIEYNNLHYPMSFRYSITSNCVLLTEDKLKFLRDNDCAVLQSIDGDKKTQDYNRPYKNKNISSFDLINNNIPNILKYYPEITFRSTIIPDTVDEMFHNYLFAETKGYKNYFIMPNNREIWSESAIETLKEQLQYIFYYRLIQFKQNILPPIQVSPITVAFELILQTDLNGFKLLNHKEIQRCGLGTTAIAIGYDKKLYACQEQPSKEQKNIFYIGNLDNGIDKNKHIELLKKYFYSNENECEDKDYCNTCICKKACRGQDRACPSTHFDIFNNFNQKSKIQCIWEQEIFKNCLETMNILVNENNIVFEQYLRQYCHYDHILRKK